MSFFRKNDILQDILLGPVALSELIEDLMFAISSLSAGCRNIAQLLWFECLCEFSTFFVVSAKRQSNC